MKSRFLFPYSWRKIGVVLLLLGILIPSVKSYYQEAVSIWMVEQSHLGKPTYEEFINDLTFLLLIAGPLLIAFSKEKLEDEQIAQLRLDSLQWAVYFNYAVVALALIFTSDWHSLLFVVMHAVFSPLIFFIVRFRWVIYQANRSLKHEG